MPIIILETSINAPIERCFDLSRSIDLHMLSTVKTNETAIAGRTTGLIELGETVTWKAKHFGIVQTLTTEITAFEYPIFFVDEQVKGAFKSFRHEHKFYERNTGTLMTDKFEFESPLGFLGNIVNRLILTKYMTKFLQERNEVIKSYAENNKLA